MSGNTLLRLGYDYEPMPGCSEGESLVCHRLVCTLVRSGAGVLAGAKPAALFSFDLRACERACVGCAACERVSAVANEAIASLARALRPFQFGLVAFWSSEQRVMLLLYRDAAVQELLGDLTKRSFLERRGYDITSSEHLVESFAQRLSRYYVSRSRATKAARSVFPHEIGVLFGYPLEDVLGFMRNAVPTCRGPWLAYGEADEALRQFRELAHAEDSCRRNFERGLSLEQLAQACVA